MGLNYIDDRRLLQQGRWPRKIGMTKAAGDGRRTRRPDGQGQGRRHPADRPVEQAERRSGVPAAEPDGRLRPSRPDQRLDLPAARARPSTRPSNLEAAKHLEQWIKAGYFPSDANAIDYATGMSRFIGGTGPVPVQRRLGVGQSRQADGGQCRLLPDAAGRGRRQARRHVGAADLRHRRQGQASRLRRVLPQLGRHQPRSPQDQRRGRRLQSRRPGRPADAGGRARAA